MQDQVMLIRKLKKDVGEAKERVRRHVEVMIDAYYSMEEVCTDVSHNLAHTHSRRSAKLSDVIAFAHRLSATASAPSHWNERQPLPRAFNWPLPTNEISASLLFPSEAKERLPKPEIRVQPLGGEYVEVVITCSEPDSLVRYTLDSSIPTESIGDEVKGPIHFDTEADFVIKAVAFKPGFLESEVAVFTLRMDTQPPVPKNVMERVQHVAPEGSLDLGFGFTPPSSSRYSDEDDFRSPSLR